LTLDGDGVGKLAGGGVGKSTSVDGYL
jgi:hypothetical protein